MTKLEEIQELKEKLLEDNEAEQRRRMGNTVRNKPNGDGS